jgi:hypothetical protein
MGRFPVKESHQPWQGKHKRENGILISINLGTRSQRQKSLRVLHVFEHGDHRAQEPLPPPWPEITRPHEATVCFSMPGAIGSGNYEQ